MPSVVAKLKVKEDKIEEAKVSLKQLAEKSLANEPGTLIYQVHQDRKDPATFIFYEKYASDEALAEHSANLKSAGAVFAAILAGAPEISVIDEV